MKLLVDKEIKELVEQTNMINPFIPETVSKDVISYGLGPMGYDIRLLNKFRISKYFHLIDPKEIKEKDRFDYYFPEVESNFFTLPRNSSILGMSIEEFNMPSNVIGICLGKSTYARCGILVNVTPLEPGWKGRLVIEIANLTSSPVRIYANEGIAQILFFQTDIVPDKVYMEKGGKYQNQESFVIKV